MWVGAILVSILSILLFIIASPLGSIGGINNFGQNAYSLLGFSFDESTPDGVTCPGNFLYAMLVLSVFLGAVGGSLLAKEFSIRIAPKPEMAKGLVGGILMGIGGSIGMGCTISGFYSSIPALSAGGLFFTMGLFIGVFIALRYLIWESERFPWITEGTWRRYLGAEKGRPSWQSLAGVLVLLGSSLLILRYDAFSVSSTTPDANDIQFIGFILIGLLIGIVLQRSRFCIFRSIREPFLTGDPRPAQAIIIGLLVGLVGFTVIKGTGQGNELSFIFPNFWIPGLVGGIIFGVGMTSAGGCSISSTWRAAEGNLKHWFTLIGIAISMPLTGEYLKPWFLDLIPSAAQQAEFLPDTLGYAGGVFLILLILFTWYVILKWNEQSGFLLLIGRPRSFSRPARKDFILANVIVLLLLSGTLIFAIQNQYWDENDKRPTDEIFQERIVDFLFSGRPSTITAPDLYTLLADGYSGNDPMIISLRSGPDYELGHIPGAVRIDPADVFASPHYEGFSRERLIIVSDDTGHQSSEIASLFNIMGFQAVSLEWGLASWTPNTTIAPEFYLPNAVPSDLPLANGTEPGAPTRSWHMQEFGQCGITTPPMKVEGDDEEALRSAIRTTLLSQTRSTISASDLHSSLTQSTPLSDPFVLDIRSPPRYQNGHIPGGVNMDLETMFRERSFGSLPEEGRTIVVVADTPYMGSRASAYLDILGYQSLALEYGMASWTSDPGIAPVQYDRTVDCHNYPVTIGPDGGSWNSAEIAGKTREEILREAAVSLGTKELPVMNATEIFTILDDDNFENDPIFISIQEPQEYFIARIPLSSQSSSEDLFSRKYLMELTPVSRPLVIIDTDGQEAATVTAFLNLLGFDAAYLQYGMCGWTNDSEKVSQPLDITDIEPFPTVNGTQSGSLTNTTAPWISFPPAPLTPPSGLPWWEPEVYSREWDILRQAIQDLLLDPPAPGSFITREALYYDLIDDLPWNDPYLVSLRTQEEYVQAHIPGARNLPPTTLLDPRLIADFPTGRTVTIISLDGEEASIVSAMLRLNGIESSFLRHGMNAWDYDAAYIPNPCVDPGARINDYPLNP